MTGRVKDAINRGGETIPPGDVETAFADCVAFSLAGGARLMAFAFPHNDLQEVVGLAVAPHSARVGLTQLRAHAASHLPPSAHPQALVLLPELPRGASGKLLRARFADQCRAALPPLQMGQLRVYALENFASLPRLLEEFGTTTTTSAASAAGEAEAIEAAEASRAARGGSHDVEKVLAQVLHVARGFGGEHVAADTHLTDEAGVNSLAAVEVALQVSEQLGVRLQSSLLSDFPTPREIAEHIAATQAPIDAAEQCNHLLRRASTQQAPASAVATNINAEPAADSTLVTAPIGKLRVLMLHGEGADAQLMRLSLRATGWEDYLPSIEMICMDAPHECLPKPQFHRSAVDAGVYTKPAYRSWGTLRQSSFDASVAAVMETMRMHSPVHAIGGIGDGGLVAAVVASRVPHLLLYLNVSSSAPDRLPPALRDVPLQINIPSVHLVSPADEMLTMEQQMQLPMCSSRATVLQHDRGHSVPALSEPLKSRLIGALAPHTTQATPAAGLLRMSPKSGGGTAYARMEAPSATVAPIDSMAAIMAFGRDGAVTTQADAQSVKNGYLLFLISFTVISFHYSMWLLPEPTGVTAWDAAPRSWERWPKPLPEPLTALSLGMPYWPLIAMMRGMAMRLAFALAGNADARVTTQVMLLKRALMTFVVLFAFFLVVVKWHFLHFPYFPGHTHSGTAARARVFPSPSTCQAFLPTCLSHRRVACRWSLPTKGPAIRSPWHGVSAAAQHPCSWLDDWMVLDYATLLPHRHSCSPFGRRWSAGAHCAQRWYVPHTSCGVVGKTLRIC